LAAFACASLASAQVNLTTVNPPAAQPGATISIGGNGYPSGPIATGNVSVTITPPPGNGSPVFTGAGNVLGAGSNRSVLFAIPAALTVSTPLTCLVSITGSAPNAFTTTTQASLTIQPPPTVLSASPGAGQLGSNGVTLKVVGAYTHFTSNTTVALTLVQTGPPPVTTTINENALSTVLIDATHVNATFDIPNSVPTGAYTVTARTGTEIATLPGGFLVASSGPLSLSSILPNTLPAGQATSVSVVGVNTHFVQGTTIAAFGDGVTPSSVTVTDSTHASFFIGTDPITAPGGRTLTMATGGEFATGTFAITNNGATLTTVGTALPAVCASGCSGPQGTNATLSLTGLGTHWIQAGTNVGVGGGINVGNITVTSPTTLLANISIGPGVPVGSYPVTAITNGEVVGLSGAFLVTAATPYLSSVFPNTGAQGQANENVNFTGVFTSFTHGAISANFGSNITVNSVTPNTDLSATANISIASTAAAGGRSGTLTSNGANYGFTFTVTPSNAALISSTPNSGLQGASVALQVAGANTHWADGLTFASLGAGIVVNRVVINSATTAEVDIAIPTNASVGTTSLTMSTGGEIVTLNNAFTVLASTPSLTMAPSSGMIPVAPATQNIVNVNFSGNFTHFALNSTIATIDGNGASIQNFTVLNKWNATAQIYIVPTAPASPTTPCANAYGGNRTVTLETPIATGSEIVRTGFCVTSTPAVLTSINPYHSAEPASNLNITITGQYTHFETGVTTVGFGPNITVVPGSVNVTSATTLTATINIDSSAALGWRPVFVNTVDAGNSINEQLTIGFAIDPPATSSLLSVLPNSGIQGQSLSVQITGNLTNWAQGATTAIFGAGISVNTLTINSTASATAQISIDPVNAPVGGSSVTMVTQLASGNEEVVSGPLFSVTQGVSSIDHMGLSCEQDYVAATNCQQHQLVLHQGDITPLFNVFGTGTHWLAGETTLNFGSDIAVSQLIVKSPTWIQCQIAVAYTAAIGFRGATAVTNAEIAPSFSDALNILAVQGSSVNITPTSGVQGNTFTVQVNGANTHWTSTAANPTNNTTANFGNNNGVNVTAIAVVSQTQMNLTVQVLGTAYVGPYTLTITTTGLPIGAPPLSPQSTEQFILNNVLSIGPGAAIITNATPTSGAQNGTAQIHVTGQNTSFLTGVTTAYFSTDGCNPPSSAGINVSNVTAADVTHATLAIAVSATAPTGYQTLCMYTQGESVSYGSAFQVLPGNPTLNSVSVTGPAPATGTSAQQGETVNISLLGQYTHWGNDTTVTFGQGISVSNLIITSSTSATATLIIDGAAYIGGRTTTVTTDSEIVSGNYFSVTQSDATISTINPSSANQGQRILMTINGDFTHWSQELTQFSISGGGYDIKVNGVVINSPTQAVADLSILNVSGNSGLGTRSIYMSTVGENVSLQSGFLITGGVPSIVSVSPSYGTKGDTADNVLITGQFTQWDATTVVDFGDPAITVGNTSTVNSNTSYTAVIAIGSTATTGVHTVTVRTGTAPNFSVQLGQYTVYNPAAPPTPYISYEYPSVALVGQTLAVNLNGAYTNWLPGQTTVSFGAGIQVNTVALQELDVTSLTTAVANITIVPGATVGPRTVTVTTGTQQLTTTFYVTVGTPAITLVSTNSAAQGETRLLDLVGQYTTWTDSGSNPTQFAFCSAVTSVSNVQIFGTNAARVQVTINPLANTGYCPVTATTGTEVANLGGGGYFYITPSTATITSVTPNTALQNAVGVQVHVVGFATLWTSITQFSFGGGVNVITQNVTSNTTADLTLNLDLYASPGTRTLTATTGGEVASLNNAFVVQPGTPILLSATNASNQQQAEFSLGILGQYTNWTSANTTVTFPNGGVTGAAVNVTSPQSITVTGAIIATAYPGCGPVVVTTTGQIPPVLTLYGFCITPGPAAVTHLSPNTLGQGQSGNVDITGTNTNFLQGTTVANFGPGISVNTLVVHSATTATANITIGAYATPEANNVVLTTAGETASDASAFTIFATTPVILDVFPNSGTQSQTLDVCITSAFTHFVNGNTAADFGPNILVNSTTVAATASCPTGDATHADVNITIKPTALTTPGNTNHIRMITNLPSPPAAPGTQEIAVWQNSSATTQYNFEVDKGGASISSATPFSPATVHQNDTGDIVKIVGSGTHFTAATPNVAFCTGVSAVGQTVVDDTHITATVNVSTFAPVGACGVTVTTLGEVANGTNLFNVLAGLPVITQVNPNSARQNDGQTTPVSVTITGLYTHFQSGALAVTFPAGVTVVSGPTPSSNTSLTVGIKVDPAAGVGAGNVTVFDTTDTLLTRTNGFTVNAGIPSIFSVSPNTGTQGSTQTITITGNYTAWTSSSVVQVSGGSDVTVGTCCTIANLANGYQQTLQVPFTVTVGAAATSRTVFVTTGGQQLSLSNAFTVQPGVTTISQITPNIGVNGVVNLSVVITGQFTHFVTGMTANFGQGISVNGFAEGADGTIAVNSATSATATLAIDASQVTAPLGARNVTITDPTDGAITVVNGFTVQANTTTPPTIVYISPTSNASNVPTNTKVTVVFSEPMNAATMTAANVAVTDSTVAGCYPSPSQALQQNAASPSLDASGRVLTITLNSLLAVGRTFDLTVNDSNAGAGQPIVSDQSGNHLGYNSCYAFTTGFAADNSGPTFVSANMAAGSSGVPTNSPVILGFDKPINPATIPAGLSVTQGGNPVPGTWGYSSDFTQATFDPASNLTASTVYNVAYSAAVTDAVDTPLTNPGNFNFTTGTGTVTNAATLVTYTPPNNSTTGVNPMIRVVFDRPINPLSVNASTFYIYDQLNSATVPASITASPDRMTFTLIPSVPLLPSTQYHVDAYVFYDWANNYTCCANWTFYTGAAITPDVTAPSVTSVSPPGGAGGVPVNPVIYVHFSEQLDPTTLKQTNISLTPAAAGTVAFVSGDLSTVTFTPTSSLSVSTPYTINVSGFSDLDGNAMAAFGGSGFTTGASSTPDTSHGTMTATPANSATNVPVNTQVVVTMSKPVDAVTVNSSSFNLYDNTGGAYFPGAITISASDLTLTFTPTNPYEPNHQYCIRVSYNTSLYDLAGNYFNNLYSCFTAGSTADTTPPTVSASPSGGVTGIGPTNPVILTFSKSMNSGTLNGNVAIYNGSTLYTSGYNLSGDNTTVVFGAGYLPFSTTFTVVVNPDVTDLAGNHLAAPFSTTFTTAPQPVVARPSVTAMRPANGATGVPLNAPITFFMSAPMNAATITSSTLLISQNGVLLPGGAISVTGNNQDVEYTPPAAGFTPGALIQVFFTSGAQDANGNSLYNFQSQFSIAADYSVAPPTPLSYYPCRYCSNNDTTTVIDILFSKPLNPATLTGNIYVKDNNNNLVPTSAPVLADGGRLLLIKPTSPLKPNTYDYVYLTTGLQDLGGNAAVFPGSVATYDYYFYTDSTANSAAPFVTATAPTNSATGIGTNAAVSVTFSGNIDPNTVDPANITLSDGGSIPLSASYNASAMTMTVTPMAPLPPSALITLTLNGITDQDGDALNPTPYQLQFTTGAGPDYSGPVLTQSNIVNGQTGVPVTSNFTLTFNKPIDWRTVNYGVGSSLILRDNTSGYGLVAATVTPIGSNGLRITPVAPDYPLNVNHQYQIYGCGIADLNGNEGGCYYVNITFYTALTAPVGGPVVTQIIPPNGGVAPTNFQPQVQFDRPLNPLSLSGVTLTQGAATVNVTPVLTGGGTILTLVPARILLPTTAYTFTVTGVQDPAGNTQVGSSVRSFTTGASFDLFGPQLSSVTPINGSTTGTNPLMRFTFSETLNPIQSSGYTFYNIVTGRSVNGSALNWASDFKSVTFTYPNALDPDSRYEWYIGTITDLAGNNGGACCYSFYTNDGADNTPETVTSVTPPNNQGGVPLNAVISLRLAKPASPGSINNSSVTLATLPGPVAVAGTAVSLSSDGMTITLAHANLTGSSNYQIAVPGGGFTDQDGNAVTAFTSAFTTGASTDSSNGTISMSNPSPGTLGTPLTQTITATFSKPVNPNSLSGQYFVVCRNQNCNYQVAGAITNPSPNTLLFTPSVALPSNTRIDVYVGYYAAIQDLAGNNFNYLYDANFTTSSATDTTPPQVTSITPANGATNVGPYAPIAISFNKSLDYTTINSANFALYNGSSLIGASVSSSSDRSVVYLSTTLPYSANLTVAISTNVLDYNGNNMVSPCSAPLTAACTYSFTTETQPLTSNPSVIQQRPGNGAAPNIPITLFLSAPMNHGSVQDGTSIFVAQNGVLIPGSVSFTADSHGIIWTPNSGSFLAGALIEVYLYSPAADINGNVVNSYSTSFHIAAAAPSASTPPVEVAYTPCRYCTEPAPELQPVIEVQFSKPIACGTATNNGTVAGSSFYALEYGQTANFVAGAISCPTSTLVRFTPSAALVPGAYYYVYLTGAIQDTDGNSFSPDNWYFYVQNAAVADNTPPTVASVTPVNNATGIGDNAPIRVVFSKLIDTLTFNPSTVSLHGGGSLPYTVTFGTINSGAQTVATIMPQSPLPDSTLITLALTGGANGINDYSGNPLTSTSFQFTTMAGADFSGPSAVLLSVDNDNRNNVPVNTTFTIVFNKPLDPATVVGAPGDFDVYDYSSGWLAAAATVSTDGRTVTIVPNADLVGGHTFYYYWCNANDLNGNGMSCGSQQFTTSSSQDTTPPTVVATNPLNGNTTTVPTNAMIEVDFSEAVRGTSLGAITLSAGGNVPITAVLNNGIYTDDTVVRLIPQQLLLPNTVYTVSVSGVEDVAGNVMSAPFTFSFTTGANFQTVGLVLPTVTVTTGAGPNTMPTSGTLPNVTDSPTFTVVFDHALDYSALLHTTVTIRDTGNNIVAGVTLNYVMSADQKTVTVTTSGLAAATTYHFALEVGPVWLYDIAGNQTSGWGSQTYSFTTQ
jgi:hypothetical protein